MVVFNYLKRSFFLLPARKNLTFVWNLGSLLGFIFVVQLLRGVILVFYYSPSSPFDDVQYIIYDVDIGWLVRSIHFNGARFFFICIYFHIMKGIFFGRFRIGRVWNTGVIMILLFIAVAFIGYVLVYSQISYWAAVVITSLLTILPFWGETVVLWVWGSYRVVIYTVKLLFVLHFLLPWLGVLIILVHLFFLHKFGRSSSLRCHGDYEKVLFFPVYWVKDGMNIFFLFLFFCWVFFFPFVLGDGEMFLFSDFINRPRHIVPEWYFLFAYAILRAIPNKFFGVVALILRIAVLMILSLRKSFLLKKRVKFIFFIFLLSRVVLTWVGGCTPDFPFIFLSQFFSFIFFFIIFFMVFFRVFVMLLFLFIYSIKNI